jgi:peptide methionine sulfoxide reductase MsrA
MEKKSINRRGCFWGMEDLFRVRPGVKDTEVGYLGRPLTITQGMQKQ